MNAMLIAGSIIMAIWFILVCVAIYETTDIQVDLVGRTRNFAGGSQYISRTRCRGHKIAKAACNGPDGLWNEGDLLIYSADFLYQQGHYYLFRKYETRDLNPFHPTVLIFKCISHEPYKRPVFEEQLGSNYTCIGKLAGIQVNGKNMLF